MSEHTEPVPPAGSDTPAHAIGFTALVLGIAAVSGLWPTLTFLMLPVMLIAGALAFGFGLVGIHHALRGIGRLWMAVTGAVLGAIGFAYPFVLFLVLPFVL